ncbi:unnamed protein product [Rotaria sordida]|uniref:Uncharacterized protein n=1 Tax=Rotaria sordida TaxID=392033 RepID=A0A819NXC1_9BILA|nr:unnamed protein product [Rotaria sordida]CAF4006736.1 unnamed protein product [Rotaria sordida]
MKYWPFKIVDKGGKSKIQVEYKNEIKLLTPVEIFGNRVKKNERITEEYLESSAAAIAYGLDKRTSAKRNVLTLDVSILTIEEDEDIDLHSIITHARFEVLNADLFQSILELVEKSLRDAKMDKSEIDEVVLVEELNKSMRSDEAVAYGGAV